MKKLFFISLATILVLVACKKVEDPGEAPRLFRPVLKEALESNGNWIKTSWQAVAGSASYTAEISTDSFKTVAASIKIDTNVHLFENLYWEKLYQVRVKANATDTAKSSKFASLGEIKTARFPTILNIPALSEVNDNSVKVSWTTSGAAVTEVKILLAADSSVVKTATLNATDVTNAYKLVSGLNASTAYIVFLYSGTTVRGWANYTTKAALVGALIDLRGITGVTSLLMDTIPDVASGSIILLKRGEQYNISTGISLNKSLTFMAGDDLLNPAKPVIYMPSNFNIVSGSVIDSIVFNDVMLRGSDYASKYVFNINVACTIGKIRFENCVAEIFRGVVRTQSQPAIIGAFEVNNCIVDSIAGYGLLTVDVVTSRADVIKVTNSTFYKTEKVISSRNNAVSVLVENCTFNESPLGNSGSYYVDFGTAGTNNVTNGITVNNCIFGVGKYSAGAYTVRDVRANAATAINASNNYRTSDHLSAGNDLPSITTYTKTAVQLWQNPTAGDFKIIDNTFPGRNSTGDPRWRP
ncbi:MAG: DUF5123 domain-containing protein [Lacibacter sp.]|nr:DUF5123 domain-containing protein [Lacibacter sp.]